jgi:hypothetical protein
MKRIYILLIVLAIALPAFAGGQAEQNSTPPQPPTAYVAEVRGSGVGAYNYYNFDKYEVADSTPNYRIYKFYKADGELVAIVDISIGWAVFITPNPDKAR